MSLGATQVQDPRNEYKRYVRMMLLQYSVPVCARGLETGNTPKCSLGLLSALLLARERVCSKGQKLRTTPRSENMNGERSQAQSRPGPSAARQVLRKEAVARQHIQDKSTRLTQHAKIKLKSGLNHNMEARSKTKRVMDKIQKLLALTRDTSVRGMSPGTMNTTVSC